MRNSMWQIGVVLMMGLLAVMPASAQEQMSTDYFPSVNSDREDVRKYLGLVEQHHLDKVIGFIREERYSDAMTEIKWTLDRFYNHPKALALSETVATLTGVPALPGHFYGHALEVYPQYPLTHAQYGRYLVEIGQKEKGVASLERSVKMDSELVTGYIWLAEAYQKTGNRELARKAADRARSLGYTGELPGFPAKAKN